MREMPHRRGWVLVGTVALAMASAPATARAQGDFDRTRERGGGIPLSMFGTWIRPGELIVYPFGEYYQDNDAEYSPAELGYGLDQDFRGRYRAIEGLIFIAYGVSDRLAIEFEAAVISARQDKSPDDPTDMPDRIEQSGLGDVEGQLRWRWADETDSRPELFSYFETVFPVQKDKLLIGTSDWEFKLGVGATRGFRWGTMTGRLSVIYDEGEAGTGEYAIEYFRRLSTLLALFAAVEGEEDEVELITETQWSFSPTVTLKLNNAFGLTSKAAGWAPEVGLVLRFP